ncbi:MAG: hypothetical protein GXP54_13875 [Deltaproteobacteria bacterium]|nr:hypothetical protein [Deltaproteobacteria bacterium]
MKPKILWAGAVTALLLSAACSNPTEAPTRNLRRPTAMAATCIVGSEPGDCSDPQSYGMTLWILDADRNSLAVLDFASGAHMDTDPFVPGFNSIALGGDLVDLAASRDSQDVYLLSRKGRELIRVDTTSLEQTRQALPCASGSFSLLDSGPLTETSAVALVACPEPAGLAIVPLDEDFGVREPGVVQTMPLTGMPWKITVSADGTAAFVTHGPSLSLSGARLSYLSKINLKDGTEERVGIGPACADGLDNDADGLTDNGDPGCAGPEDDDESQDGVAVCANGIDDDGDGFTDMDDPDCGDDPAHPISEFHLIPWPACMNLRDDDGDGLTDAGEDPDCFGPDFGSESSPAPRPAGRPAVSPDGAWVYVPTVGPDMLAVYRTDPFERVLVTAADGPAPNPLLERLGIDGIRLTVPPVEIAMSRAEVTNEAGQPDGEVTRAFVSLSSGQVIRVVVEDKGAPIHDLDLSGEQLKSTAGVPVLKLNGEVVDRTVDLHPEYPSFGPRAVSSVPGEADDVFSYYGIVFHGDPSRELSETWRVTYEGVVPGAAGNYGFLLEPGNELKDPTADFCAAGVRVGDHLVLEPAPPTCLVDVEDGQVNLCEYGITKVRPDGLDLEELDGFGPMSLLASLPQPVTFVVRVSDSWTVVGSQSGFLHNRVQEGGECVDDVDVDPGFSGRAFTSLPHEGTLVDECPPLEGDPSIDWRPFSNLSFSFNLFPPCETDETLESNVVSVPRGLELSFVTAGGRTPLLAGPGGILKGLTIVGSYLYFADSTSGAVYQVNTETMEMVKTVF